MKLLYSVEVYLNMPVAMGKKTDEGQIIITALRGFPILMKVENFN